MSDSAIPVPRRKILITGAGGRLGSSFAHYARDKYDLRLMIQTSEQAEKIQGLGEIVTSQLADLETLKTHCTGVDTVVHMAGNGNVSALWEDLLRDNIVGTYNIIAAAKSRGVRRVILASSIHAVSGYPMGHQIRTTDPVNPGDLYGVSKCFGEALGRYMAGQEGLSVHCLRIAACQTPEAAQSERTLYMMDTYFSRIDLSQLIEKSIEAENLPFAILHGTSNNFFNRLDLEDTRQAVGYEPRNDFSKENPILKPLELHKKVAINNMSDGHQKSGLRAEVDPPPNQNGQVLT